MEAEQSQNFNERLSQWVSSQGFWFQLRHSLGATGNKGNLTFHTIRLATRLLVFAIIVGVIFSFYLVRRQKSAGYRDGIRNSIQESLSGSDSQMAGYNNARGVRNINRLLIQGGENTFFNTLEARNIRYNKDFFDDLKSVWDPGNIAITRLDIELRAGADDGAMSKNISDALFKEIPHVQLANFEVADATLHWGYSERTRGMIEGSALKILRGDGSYKLNFRGGTFSQNWLRKLEIVTLVALIDRNGITIEKAEFRKGEGTAEFLGVKISGGERPLAQGIVRLKSMNLETLLPAALQSFVEGTLSGDLDVFGSTNSPDGIGFKGIFKLDKENKISLRDRFHVLRALSVIDYSRNYHRVDFHGGQFHLKTTSGEMELTDVNLEADELFSMAGSLRVRLPKPEETQSITNDTAKEGAPIFMAEDNIHNQRQRRQADQDFTLKSAALQAKRINEGKQNEGTVSLMEKMATNQEIRDLEILSSERASRTLRYQGMFTITLPQDAFERTPRLLELHPPDPVSKLISLEVPIEGSLYEITLGQAEQIYQQGRQ